MSDQGFERLSLMMDYPFPKWINDFRKNKNAYPGSIGWTPGYRYELAGSTNGYGDGLFREFGNPDGGEELTSGVGNVPYQRFGQ